MVIVNFLVVMCLTHHSHAVNVDKCTTIIAALSAGTDGPMVTHTSDCSDCDFRINKVPARDWPIGSMRPLYLYRGEYPQTVSKLRGQTWDPANLEGTPEQLAAWGSESPITGYIPQAAHTYALYESGYGIMNEHQVAIGESTCAAKLWSAPTFAGGKASIEVGEMTRVALERSRTARETVRLMGELAVTYGFYAADWSGGDASLGEGGEALTVVDKEEAWVFHVMSDDSGTSALWVAQRVPDGHVAAVANQFVIREVDKLSPDFLFSDNLWEVAERCGFWHPSDGKLDFLATFAPLRAHSTYSTRRLWRVFNLVAPSLVLPGETDPFANDYPFSVQVDRPLSPADLMRVQRDHYEGTPFDLTQGLAAGPYGDPNRFDGAPQPLDNMTLIDIIQGSFERSISLFRTTYSFVAVARAAVPDSLALLWLAQYAPSSSTYIPLYIAAKQTPPTHSRGSLFKYDSSVAFWNFAAVGNYASRFYKYAMVEVARRQKLLEDELFAETSRFEASVCSGSSNGSLSPAELEHNLTLFSDKQALRVSTVWKEMLPDIITLFHDGYAARDLDKPTIDMHKLFYPKSWLEATGYFANTINTGPGVILFSPAAQAYQYSLSAVSLLVLITSAVSLLLGYLCGSKILDWGYGYRWRSSGKHRNEYTPLLSDNKL